MTTKNKKCFLKGKIYKIEPVCEHDDGDIYIGSTTKEYLSQRMVNHIANYKRWKAGDKNKTTSTKLLDKYGIDKCKIILLENVFANSYDELKAKEAYYINTLKCINKNIPLRTKKEYEQSIQHKLKEKYLCECGSICVSKVKNRHFKTIKHQEYLKLKKETHPFSLLVYCHLLTTLSCFPRGLSKKPSLFMSFFRVLVFP